MLNWKRLSLVMMGLVYHAAAMAQQTTDATKTGEGFMRTEGKVYVVAAVAITILIGLLIYIARLDRKLTKLEKETHKH